MFVSAFQRTHLAAFLVIRIYPALLNIERSRILICIRVQLVSVGYGVDIFSSSIRTAKRKRELIDTKFKFKFKFTSSIIHALSGST